MLTISRCLPFILPTLFLLTCRTPLRQSYDARALPAAPDYSQEGFWAALPWKVDAADVTPDGLTDQQADARADIFFLHPTTYSDRRAEYGWNGPVDNQELNERTDARPIRNQASIFNGAGRVFAPYYRQAHLQAYFTRDTASARQAFEVAYEDVRAAFRYYLEHYNQGRPIIIAAHSQGTTHGRRLVREFFDGQPLAERLVAAYLVGIPVKTSLFQELKPCRDSLQTGCLISWRTFRRGTEPEAPDSTTIVTNPLLWTTATTYAPAELNLGGVVTPFEEVRSGITDAQIHQDILWAKKPRFPGSFLLNTRNYHIGDFNLYYVNVRNNAQARLNVYLRNLGK